MANAQAAREQLVAELDRIHTQADAKDAADRMRALMEFEGLMGDFDTLYGNIDLVHAHASQIDALGVALRRAGVPLRSMQRVEGERIPDEAAAVVAEQSQFPDGPVSVAKSHDEAEALADEPIVNEPDLAPEYREDK